MPPKIPGVWGLAPKEHESHYFTLHEGIQNDFLNQLLTRIKTVAHPVPCMTEFSRKIATCNLLIYK